MRQHFHRCPSLRVVSIDASDIAGDRKGGSVILDELCQAKGLSRCVGLTDCDMLTEGQRRELLAVRVTELRAQGDTSAIGDAVGARSREIEELARELRAERDEILEANRRMLAEATAAFDDRPDDAPLGTAEDLALPDLALRSREFRAARLDALESGVDAICADPSGYGVCARCTKRIGFERLRTSPNTHVCQECAAGAGPVA